jgi:imipenem/basic amino acid-specific outer membrane pore
MLRDNKKENRLHRVPQAFLMKEYTMKNAVKWSSIALAVAMGNGLIAANAVAQTTERATGIVEGASATLSNRTMYFNRDFRETGAGKAEEAATGFVLGFESGFSEGPIGLGFDVTAMTGIKLDSGRGRSGTGLLQIDENGRASNEYSQIRGAVKASIVDDTVVRYGTHFVENPVIAYDDARLLPNHYFGYSVTNESIEGLMLELGRMNRRGEMDDSSQLGYAIGGFETTNANGDDVVIDSRRVTYGGGTYTFDDSLAASLYSSKADDLWRRHYAGLVHNAQLGGGMSLTSELSHYHTSDRSVGEFGNKATSLAFTLGAGYHGLTLAAQRMGGDAGFAYADGAIFLANSVQYLDFNATDEKSYQARYDYSFEGLGLPGLTFMTRYIRGRGIDTVAEGIDRSTRWERNTDLSYTVQAGPLEGVNVLWRNATIRQDAAIDGGDVDENRLIVSYTWNLL